MLHDPYFMPQMTLGDEVQFPVMLRWGSSEDADGIEVPIDFEGTPEFCEITVEDSIGLMIEINGRWFYKSPEVKTVDLMPAFYNDRIDGKKRVSVKLFAPPADGENHDDGTENWNYNCRTEIKNPPEFRIRYEAPAQVE